MLIAYLSLWKVELVSPTWGRTCIFNLGSNLYLQPEIVAATRPLQQSMQLYLKCAVHIKNFEVYIAGRGFELVTDHQALTYLSKSKNHNRRLMRWSIFLQDFRLQAIYRPGYMNGNADGLSRQDWDDTEWNSDGTGVKRESTFSGGHPVFRRSCDVVDHPTTGTLNTFTLYVICASHVVSSKCRCHLWFECTYYNLQYSRIFYSGSHAWLNLIGWFVR